MTLPYANSTGSFSLYCFHVLLTVTCCMPNKSQLFFLSDQHPATGISIGIPNKEGSIPSDHRVGTVDCLLDKEIPANEIDLILFGCSDDEENESDQDMWPSRCHCL